MNIREVLKDNGDVVEARLGFVTKKGVRHAVERSHDLVNWTTVEDVYGFGQRVELPVARRGVGGDVVPIDPNGENDPVVVPGWHATRIPHLTGWKYF